MEYFTCNAEWITLPSIYNRHPKMGVNAESFGIGALEQPNYIYNYYNSYTNLQNTSSMEFYINFFNITDNLNLNFKLL